MSSNKYEPPKNWAQFLFLFSLVRWPLWGQRFRWCFASPLSLKLGSLRWLLWLVNFQLTQWHVRRWLVRVLRSFDNFKSLRRHPFGSNLSQKVVTSSWQCFSDWTIYATALSIQISVPWTCDAQPIAWAANIVPACLWYVPRAVCRFLDKWKVIRWDSSYAQI